MVVRVDDRGYTIGEDHHGARYTDRDVEMVKELRDEGWSLKDISLKMDMPMRTIRSYIDGTRRGESVAGFKEVVRWQKKLKKS